MQLQEAIRERRSIGKVKPDTLDRKQIEAILEAAVWAPNHHHTEPWQFYVMTGDGRKALAEAFADIAAESAEGLSQEETAALRIKQEAKAYRAPVVIAVAARPSGQPHIPEIEELAAVHAAVQNMLLTAHDLGLGAIWRTGAAAYHPRMRQAFDLQEQEQIVGFVYIGYPLQEAPQGKRMPFSEKTTWLQ